MGNAPHYFSIGIHKGTCHFGFPLALAKTQKFNCGFSSPHFVERKSACNYLWRETMSFNKKSIPHKRSLLCAAISMSLLPLAGQSLAQDESIEEVVVTGSFIR